MWKVANTNGFLHLKMWKKCGRRNYVGYGNKYDDRKRVLG